MCTAEYEYKQRNSHAKAVKLSHGVVVIYSQCGKGSLAVQTAHNAGAIQARDRGET